jgi:RNA polymerase sigma-70 factor, ECF subfamily
VVDEGVLGEIYRREAGRCVATMVRVLGDVDLAEDAVADAFVIAADVWATRGIPANPGGWITTTARNRAIDRLRRESMRAEKQLAAHHLHDDPEPAMIPELGDLDVVPDDQLRLMFMCCHPALAPDVQVAMTLRLLGGLETEEIARAFLVPEATMAQRLVRAKRKIRDNHLTYRIPTATELPSRLRPLLAAIYLVYNEGYTATSGGALTRIELSSEAVRLARVLVELLPEEYEPRGLLALMLLTDARRPARIAPDGSLVRLADQERTRWDGDLIAEGHRLVRDCLRHDAPGPYQIQAAIAAVHADAPTAAATEWAQIVALYDHLFLLLPTPVVAFNRAIALAELSGPRAGLEALDALDALEDSHLYHAARGDLLERLGEADAAAQAFDRAIALATNDVERRFLTVRRRA